MARRKFNNFPACTLKSDFEVIHISRDIIIKIKELLEVN